VTDAPDVCLRKLGRDTVASVSMSRFPSAAVYFAMKTGLFRSLRRRLAESHSGRYAGMGLVRLPRERNRLHSPRVEVTMTRNKPLKRIHSSSLAAIGALVIGLYSCANSDTPGGSTN